MAKKYLSCRITEKDMAFAHDAHVDRISVECDRPEDGYALADDFNEIFKNSDWSAFAHNNGWVDISKIRFKSRQKVESYLSKKLYG